MYISWEQNVYIQNEIRDKLIEMNYNREVENILIQCKQSQLSSNMFFSAVREEHYTNQLIYGVFEPSYTICKRNFLNGMKLTSIPRADANI